MAGEHRPSSTSRLRLAATWCVTVLIVGSAFGQRAAKTDNPTAIFKSGVSNVKVEVQVTNNGALVQDLSLKDFKLFDQERERELLFVDRSREPLSIVLLLDVSGSMRVHIQAVASVAKASLTFLQPEDKVAVLVFGKTTKVKLPLTTDRSRIEAEINAAMDDHDVGAETAINDAIAAAAGYLEKRQESSRRSILILTDNLGINFGNPDEKVIDYLLATDCVLNAIVIGQRYRPDPTKPVPTADPAKTIANVFYIAQETGGEAIDSKDAAASFPLMIERIRARYALQYKTPPGVEGIFRRLRVELAPAARSRYPNATLHYRRGYYFKH